MFSEEVHEQDFQQKPTEISGTVLPRLLLIRVILNQ